MTGLPVVSVHDPANAASDVVRGYPMWFPSRSLDPADIAAALHEAAERASEKDRAQCVRFAERYRRDAQLAPRVRALREVLRPA